MVRLELTDEEAKELSQGLERFLSEMDREIASTDSREYRHDLHNRERLLRDVAERLKKTA